MKRRTFLGLLPGLIPFAKGLCSPPSPNFSGTWRQSNERCIPTRTGDVTLRIDHRDPELTVETTAVRSAGPPRHAVQRYTTDGRPSVSTGADGDEFHTAIRWSGSSLVFTVEEHEDGRILLSKETWTLREDGSVLERIRTRSGSGEEQTFVYLR